MERVPMPSMLTCRAGTKIPARTSPTTGMIISNLFGNFNLFYGHALGGNYLLDLGQQAQFASWQVNLCLFNLLNINPG
jgi:hypothetical protein